MKTHTRNYEFYDAVNRVKEAIEQRGYAVVDFEIEKGKIESSDAICIRYDSKKKQYVVTELKTGEVKRQTDDVREAVSYYTAFTCLDFDMNLIIF